MSFIRIGVPWGQMMQLRRFGWVVLLFAGVAGCTVQKSANPLSPSVAGPIPGVTISAPKLLEPGPGWSLEESKQPITLLIENASSTGQRPLLYLFEVATDPEFVTTVFRRDALQPGPDGRTSVIISDPLQGGREYYWRTRAADGANIGPFSTVAAFRLVIPVVLHAPQPIAPTGGLRISERRPGFEIRNASRSGPVSGVWYTFEVSSNETFTPLVSVVTVTEQADVTRFTLAQELDYDRLYYWRARAFDQTTQGPWTSTQGFRTPLAPPPPPPTPPPAPPVPTPAPTPPSTPPQSGWPTTGSEVVAYVGRAYPEYLAAGVSRAQRVANMEFLRDRVIETAICGGMDVAWNRKRGTGPLSSDAVCWRANGRDEVVDIGSAFDDAGRRLDLQWIIVAGPPGYQTYEPRPICR